MSALRAFWNDLPQQTAANAVQEKQAEAGANAETEATGKAMAAAKAAARDKAKTQKLMHAILNKVIEDFPKR
jgi:hypothetical protein